jgi:hypothetical protein
MVRTPCPVCANRSFTQNQLLPSIVVDTCVNYGLLISDINPSEPIAAEFSRINEATYSLCGPG